MASNSILSFNLWIVGDSLAQWSEHKLLSIVVDDEKPNPNISPNKSTQPNHDASEPSASGNWGYINITRTAQCASWGLFVGALLSKWYPYLDKVCKRNNIRGVWAAPFAKVIADEFIADPPIITMFYGYMNICEGGTVESFRQKMKSEFFHTWFASLAVWPTLLLGTFRFLPLHAQAPFINVCCIVWDGYLSHRNSSARHAEKKAVEVMQQQAEGMSSQHVNSEVANCSTQICG